MQKGGKEMELEVYRIRELTKLLKVSKECIYLWIRKNKFPKPLKLGARTSVWLKEDIEKWLKEKKKGEIRHEKEV